MSVGSVSPDTVRSESVGGLGRFADLQRIVQCPVERTPLDLVDVQTLQSRLPHDAMVPQGTIGAFVSTSGRGYPIVDRIVSFLDRDVLHLVPQPLAPVRDTQAEGVKASVQDWYDRFGWTKSESGLYHDTAMFSQDESSGFDTYESLSHLGFLERLGRGEFLLDAASGAIAKPEYRAYAWRHRYRVCVDLSRTALKEAAAKIGDGGFCCLADMTRLPFRESVMDGIVSGYTVQHIPESEQARAVEELYRVLKPGAHLCIMTDVKPERAAQERIVLGFRAIRKVGKILGLTAPFRPAAEPTQVAVQPHALYFKPHGIEWWQSLGARVASVCSIETLRSLTKSDFERVFGRSTRAARIVRAIDTLFPHILASGSPYCLVDLVKAPRRD